MEEVNGRDITTNNFHDIDDMCHDLQTNGYSYFPKNPFDDFDIGNERK